MKTSKWAAVLLILPFLIACDQEEIKDTQSQRFRLFSAGAAASGSNGNRAFMAGCFEDINQQVEDGDVTPAAAVEACTLKTKGVGQQMRRVSGGRGLYWGGWSGLGSWWNLGFWYTGYQNNFERCSGSGSFDFGCISFNYDYYYPQYNNFWNTFPGINFNLYCEIDSFASVCRNLGFQNDCSDCDKRATPRKRRFCRIRMGCIVPGVYSFNDDDFWS